MGRISQIAVAGLFGFLASTGIYAQQKTPLRAVFVPGEILRFDIETRTSYNADLLDGYTTVPPILPCQYSLSANVLLKIGAALADGNVPVTASYEHTMVTSWNCPQLHREELEKGLHQLEAFPVVYQVGPHGEPGFERDSRDCFTYRSAPDLLNKVTLDLLESRLSDDPVTVGDSWKARGQFTYWKDYLLNGLDLSSSRMLWKAGATLAGRNYDFITSKYIFSPTESSSGPVTAGGSVLEEPSNVLSGMLNVSLLFDPHSSHIVWLNRHYFVENHVSIQPVAEPDPEVMTINWAEEATARLLPKENAIEWLAALKQFESTPEVTAFAPRPKQRSNSPQSELVRIAPAKRRATTRELDSLDFTPKGFSRWERKFCNGAWYCTEISLALPGEVKVGEDAPLQTVYFASTDGPTFVVTVGPVLQRKYQGLTSEEELTKHTDFYLANQLWMENRPGVAIQSETGVVDGYSGKMTTFRGVRRDLNEVQGELLILLSPWGESFPVTCSAKQADFESLRDTCTHILNLVRIKRQ
jgi:hypothetical protein